MSNLKELSHRIKNIKSIQKTTKVMQLISAAKLKRSQQQLVNSRLHLSQISKTLLTLHLDLTGDEYEVTQKNSYLLIIISSDRGLCGNFNSSIIKLAKARINELYKNEEEIDIIVFGKKAYDVIKNQFKNIKKAFSCNKITFFYLEEIVSQIPGFYSYSKIEVLYNKFHNTFTQETVSQVILPLSNNSLFTDSNTNDSACYEYEGNKEFLLNFLTKNYIMSSLYSTLLESITSEHSARMIAMESANRNTKEMLNRLVLTYNRFRQAAITTDLIEVIGGVEALN
ncbi:ATP synthase F1 subunit gamma [Candidatus Mesenet endosymbiont of Agriotes lineatus]|uniref:ATP synthase F1 subunit gamma n=1 Tax=Candidatus Mesenet endosymbiont of Agriotes lineatus TaxID=3077948 RepID=UPI0030D0F7FD